MQFCICVPLFNIIAIVMYFIVQYMDVSIFFVRFVIEKRIIHQLGQYTDPLETKIFNLYLKKMLAGELLIG
jgi:hypothetical protein